MDKPIEETLIIPGEFSQFATVFPSIYRKISERLNGNPSLERHSLFLDQTPKLVYSLQNLDQARACFYLVFGNDASQPATVGLAFFYPSGSGIVTPLVSHGAARFVMTITNGDLQLSLSSGFGEFQFRLLLL